MTDAARRRFLGQAMAAGLFGAAPAVLRHALAVPAHHASGTIDDVQHVVILMQENRSFDHYFGTMAGVRGYGDRLTIPLRGGRSVWQQHNGRRIVMPYHLDQSAGNAQCTLDLPHTWPDAQAAWDDGRMGSWPRAKTDASMAYYTRAELPFQFALADAFTVCDAYHCSLPGGTNPNRLYMFTGTNDPKGAGGGPVIDNRKEGLGPVAEGYSWTTYAERLERAGVSWKVYQDMKDNYDNNMLATFRQYRAALAASGGPADAPAPPAGPAAASAAVQPLAAKALTTTLTDASLQGLRDDVLAGRLPQVSWIIAPRLYSEHPGPSTPVQGGAYTQQVLEALLADPAVWSKTVLLQMYDENDAFFDHMPPPAPPSAYRNGTRAGKSTVDFADETNADGQLYGLGPRVPMLVVSPWSKGGWVNSQVFDHTSIVRFLERRFGVMEPNISAWRRATCGDLTTCFNFAAPDTGAPGFAPRDNVWADGVRARQKAMAPIDVPSESAQKPPRQHSGIRPSRALPYRLDVVAAAVPAQQIATLTFVNRGQAGAVFHVYDMLHTERLPRRYTVEAGKQILDGFFPVPADQGRFNLWVLGPNGFHRQCSGVLANAPVSAVVDQQDDALVLTLTNGGDAAASATLTTLAYAAKAPAQYALAPRESVRVTLPLAEQRYWYDFSVQAGESGWRFAGRLETGRDGISDPAMASA